MDQVEEVKRKTDIVNLVGERVKLVRAGRNFKALCPFHSERTPSFMVSPELQIFKCFGCGKAGDVYSFLNEFDGMEFPDALNYLAQRVGVRLEPFKTNRAYQRKERLREINHLASEFYHYLLTGHAIGKKALRYLGERGIRKRAIETFKLGFAADNWDALIRYLVAKKKYKIEELASVGLIKQRSGRSFDWFRNRVMFPLRDVSGHVVGFAGRVLPGGEDRGGKYINSPETELYHKSEHLYGLHENRSFIKKKDQVVVVEGELDVISSWQAGVKQVVAVKGTALTSEQVELQRRYTRNVTLALDADAAGEAAMKRSIALADSAALNINVALLVGGKDPDEISQLNPKKWRRMVEKASSVYDFYISSAKTRFDLATGIGKKQASEEVIPVLAKITNSVEQAHYVKKFARLLDISDESVVDEIRRYERTASVGVGAGKKDKVVAEGEAEKPRAEVLEEYLLALLLQGGKQVLGQLPKFSVKVVSHPAISQVIKRLLKIRKSSYSAPVFIGSLPAELHDMAQQAFLRDLDITSESEAWGREISRVVTELKQIAVRRGLAKISTEIEELEGKLRLSSEENKRLGWLRKKFSELSQELSGSS